MSKGVGFVSVCRPCRQHRHLGELYGTLEPVPWPPNAAANVLFARRYAATTLLDFVAWLLVIL